MIMKKNFLLFMAAGLLLTAAAHAQIPLLNGTWTLERAIINRQINGLSEQVHALTLVEINAKQIPTVFVFGNSQVTFTVQGTAENSDYLFDKGELTYGTADKRSVSMAWLEGETSLVVVSEYNQSDFAGNEMRLTYKKTTPNN
jgi:hypothetical protein